MCRALAYLGEPVLLDHLLFQPDRSLVKQAYMPRMLRTLNLAGFGMMAWDPFLNGPSEPLSYKSTTLPVFDANLKSLAEKLRTRCLLAHVRGVPYTTDAELGAHNLHPFRHGGARVALAHNGDIAGMAEMRQALAPQIKSEVLAAIRGTTDSEWIYALLMSHLGDPGEISDGQAIAAAIEKALRAIREARRRCGIETSSFANLFVASAASITAVRFCFDFGRFAIPTTGAAPEQEIGYLSLWYTAGRDYGLHDGEWQMIGGEEMADSVIVASEPLTTDRSSWLEVPEYTLLHVDASTGRPVMHTRHLDC